MVTLDVVLAELLDPVPLCACGCDLDLLDTRRGAQYVSDRHRKTACERKRRATKRDRFAEADSLATIAAWLLAQGERRHRDVEARLGELAPDELERFGERLAIEFRRIEGDAMSLPDLMSTDRLRWLYEEPDFDPLANAGLDGRSEDDEDTDDPWSIDVEGAVEELIANYRDEGVVGGIGRVRQLKAPAWLFSMRPTPRGGQSRRRRGPLPGWEAVPTAVTECADLQQNLRAEFYARAEIC